jgi:hypothetical protein
MKSLSDKSSGRAASVPIGIQLCGHKSPTKGIACELPNRHWESVGTARRYADRAHMGHDTGGQKWMWGGFPGPTVAEVAIPG